MIRTKQGVSEVCQVKKRLAVEMIPFVSLSSFSPLAGGTGHLTAAIPDFCWQPTFGEDKPL